MYFSRRSLCRLGAHSGWILYGVCAVSDRLAHLRVWGSGGPAQKYVYVDVENHRIRISKSFSSFLPVGKWYGLQNYPFVTLIRRVLSSSVTNYGGQLKQLNRFEDLLRRFAAQQQSQK